MWLKTLKFNCMQQFKEKEEKQIIVPKSYK